MVPLVVHQPASLSIWQAVQSLRRGLSTTPDVTMWCVYVGEVEDIMCVVCVCVNRYRGGHSGDGCDLASTLCKYRFEEW